MASLDLAAASSAQALARERSAIRHVDLTLVLATAGLAAFGLLMVYSATHRSLAQFGEDPGFFLKKQAVYLAMGAMAMVAAASIQYRLAKVYAGFLYLLGVMLLVLVRTPLGTTVAGAQRWFEFGGFQLTPSLFMRTALVVMLAALLSEVRGELGLRDVVRAATLAAIPMALVLIQPDIGTTMILAVILLALLVVGGARARHLGVLGLIAIVGIFGAFQLHIIKDYQLQRIYTFLDASDDPQRAGYNRQQAEIAIGAGGFSGRGYLQGTQTNLDFVPEQHTDFIFTVVGEELGFVGGTLLLVLFAVVLWRAFRIALLAKDPFGTCLATGIGAMIAIQVFVNVGMTIGIMPVTGIPLPFVSYGGSALIADLIGIGLLLNVHMRRFT